MRKEWTPFIRLSIRACGPFGGSPYTADRRLMGVRLDRDAGTCAQQRSGQVSYQALQSQSKEFAAGAMKMNENQSNGKLPSVVMIQSRKKELVFAEAGAGRHVQPPLMSAYSPTVRRYLPSSPWTSLALSISSPFQSLLGNPPKHSNTTVRPPSQSLTHWIHILHLGFISSSAFDFLPIGCHTFPCDSRTHALSATAGTSVQEHDEGD